MPMTLRRVTPSTRHSKRIVEKKKKEVEQKNKEEEDKSRIPPTAPTPPKRRSASFKNVQEVEDNRYLKERVSRRAEDIDGKWLLQVRNDFLHLKTKKRATWERLEKTVPTGMEWLSDFLVLNVQKAKGKKRVPLRQEVQEQESVANWNEEIEDYDDEDQDDDDDDEPEFEDI